MNTRDENAARNSGAGAVRMGRRAAIGLAAVLAAVLAAAGCAHQRALRKPPVIEMPPLHITAGADKQLGIAAYDDRTLLEEGKKEAEVGNHAVAVRYFDRLVREYADSDLYPEGLFRLGYSLAKAGSHAEALKVLDDYLKSFPEGEHRVTADLVAALCQKNLGDNAGALSRFNRISRETPNTPDDVDARFYAGECLMGLNRQEEAIRIYEELVKNEDLLTLARIEAYTRIGECRHQLNQPALAEDALRKALSIFREREQAEYLDPRFVAEAQFTIGEIYNKQFKDVPLVFPQEVMEKNLEHKAELLLRAQANYIRTIRLGDAKWAAASGYRIGGLYEDFYDQIMNTPAPPELEGNQDTADYYHDMLRKKVQVLVSKAIGIYERNLDLAERVGLSGEWVSQTHEHLERMKKVFLGEDAGEGKEGPPAEDKGQPPPPPETNDESDGA